VARVICILGMHRSGTSCLAGSLEEAGVYLGDVNTSARHNLKGNRESPRIWQLHDAVLLHSGGSWAQPPEQVSWTDAHRAERDAIIRSYADRSLWGFKDPRALLCLDFWLEAAPRLSFVGTFRHPALVAASLRLREGGEVEHWFKVWARYNQRLLSLYQTRPFPVLRFDVADDDYRRRLGLVAASLDLRFPRPLSFFDPDLRHQNLLVPHEVPWPIRTLYQSLCHIALAPPPEPE
jgi:hypothetical protein